MKFKPNLHNLNAGVNAQETVWKGKNPALPESEAGLLAIENIYSL